MPETDHQNPEIDYQDTDVLAFAEKFPDEESCRRHLFKMRWPGGFVCPRCGHENCYDLPRRRLYQCKNCKYQASVTAGTVMHRTRTPLLKWFWAIFLTSNDKRGISALALSKRIGVSYWIAWTMLGKIRKAMQDRDARYKLADIVELDDSYFGKTPTGDSKRVGRGTEKLPVLIELSTDDSGKPLFARMRVLPSVSGADISDAVREDVVPGCRLKTDGWLAYRATAESGFIHEPSNVYDSSGRGDFGILNWVHTLIGNAKSFIQGTYHGLGAKHLSMYLDEFCYRFNRRFWEPQLFERLLRACTTSHGITYSELTQ